MKRKRFSALVLSLAMACAAGVAQAQIVPDAQPDGHIRRRMVIGGVPVEIDADVYGTSIQSVQAYRLRTLNPCKDARESNTALDLSVWFGDEPVSSTMLFSQDEMRFVAGEGVDALSTFDRDTAHISPYSVRFNRMDAERLDEEKLYDPQHKGILYQAVRESANIEPLDGLDMQDALDRIAPLLDWLGVTAIARPISGASFTVDDLNAQTQAHLLYGVSPSETVIKDWTAQDEHIELLLPILYHGLMVLPTDAHMPGISQWETGRASVRAIVSRQGVRRLEMDFVPGEERPTGDAFTPITLEEALAACERIPQSAAMDDISDDARVSEIRLGYVMMTENIACTEATARPAWMMYVFYDMPIEGYGETYWTRTFKPIAIDAQTGESLLVW